MTEPLALLILGSFILILLIAILFLFKVVLTLRHESLTDHLTQLPNRRFFDQELKRLFSHSQRFQESLSLITMDLDFFKKYNDTNGHPAGDRLLQKFANLLKNRIRQSDFIARTGGEEFIIVCPHTDLAGAKLLAKRIRADAPKELNGTTLSLGIAGFPKDAKEEKELVEKSDQALYKAKEKRNCVVAYEDMRKELD